jgi:hypothetical protein
MAACSNTTDFETSACVMALLSMKAVVKPLAFGCLGESMLEQLWLERPLKVFALTPRHSPNGSLSKCQHSRQNSYTVFGYVQS